MDLYNLYKQFDKDKICLSYLGDFDDEVTHNIIELSDFNLQNNNDLIKIKSRVSFLIAECFQNVVRHKIDADDKDKSEKFFQVNIFPDLVCLSSANPVSAETKKFIGEKISQLNTLSEDELKKLHSTLLGSSDFNDKGGAGLGLIEMARKSRHPLRFFFKDLDANRSEFFLTLEVINKKAAEPETSNHIQRVVENYYALSERNILLMYKGDFTMESVNSITEMLQPNLIKSDASIGMGKKALIIILELIQNISKHGLAIGGNKNGIFFMANKDGHYNVTAGNFISNQNAQKISERLSNMQKLSVEEVNKQYKSVLFDNEISVEGNGSLGILEIAKMSKNQFDFSIQKLDNEMSFFEISVKL